MSELKRLKEIEERKRNEREIIREEVIRAKKEEREGRVRAMKVEEEKMMETLREIARVRFGGGGGGRGGVVEVVVRKCQEALAGSYHLRREILPGKTPS